jgi:hypothetical protein
VDRTTKKKPRREPGQFHNHAFFSDDDGDDGDDGDGDGDDDARQALLLELLALNYFQSRHQERL